MSDFGIEAHGGIDYPDVREHVAELLAGALAWLCATPARPPAALLDLLTTLTGAPATWHNQAAGAAAALTELLVRADEDQHSQRLVTTALSRIRPPGGPGER